jgi:hypothetical protein
VQAVAEAMDIPAASITDDSSAETVAAWDSAPACC